MRRRTGMWLPMSVLLLATGLVGATDDEHDAILAVMEQAFAAVASGNPDHWRAVQVSEGTSLWFQPGTNADGLEMRIATNESILPSGTGDARERMERWTSEPTVLVHGPIALVWGEYEYWVDGHFSHCGIDAINLVKLEGEWKIANWSWTREKDGCPTDPSRRPE